MIAVSAPIVTVITPSRNAAHLLPVLYESLKQQNRQNFEWIVVDSCSTDGTLTMLESFAAESPWCTFIAEPDFGIYDAINKGLAKSKAPYYVVAGADDRLDPSAIDRYTRVVANGDVDVVLAKVIRGGRTIGGFSPRRAWIGPSKAFRGSHSVGMLFRKTLHIRFGFYSNRFPLLADAYFLKQLLRSGLVKFSSCEFVAGFFSDTGVSSTSKLQTLAETWQIQVLTERRLFLQTGLFIGKVLIRYLALVREHAVRKRSNE